ncbi:MAG: glycosyltransferase family 4 protein [Acidimicrobiia bacterium]|nr:glycosyltransferase family 4 protein [Acidimicrobiia bacterium]
MTRNPERLRVAVDGMPLIGERTGIGQVTVELLRALAPRGDLDLVLYVVTRNGRRRLGDDVPAAVRVGTSQLPARLVRPAWEHLPFPRVEHWTGPVDVVHATNYVAPPARAPVIVTVHDLTFVHQPDLVSEDTRRFFEPLLHRAIARGATIHVVSDYVGEEVRAAFGLGLDHVVRVYPGITATGGGDPAAGRRVAGAERYVLALGQLEPRKNLPNLVRAFDQLADTDRDLRLVIAGPDGWGRPDFEAAVDSATHGDRVRWLGYVSDDDRRDLLAGATAFAYPSLYEGFGHPPLEAMAAGVPVVATTAGAVPEISGDAALLADPLDPDVLADQLTRAICDEQLRADLITRGHARVREFSWGRAADEFVELYRRVATR